MGAVCSTQQAVDVAGPARKKLLLPTPIVLSVKEDDLGADVAFKAPKASRKRRGSVGPSTGAPCILSILVSGTHVCSHDRILRQSVACPGPCPDGT